MGENSNFLLTKALRPAVCSVFWGVEKFDTSFLSPRIFGFDKPPNLEIEESR